MKILFVCSGNKSGKPGIVVYNQAQSLKKHVDEVFFYLIISKGLKGYLYSIIPLFKHIRRKKYDVIHSHYSLSAFVSSFALSLPGAPEIPHVVSLMGSDTQMFSWNTRLVSFFSKRSWNAKIVKSQSMCSAGVIKQAQIIPNGVDLNIVKYRCQRTNTNDRQVILFPASPFRESKNFLLAQKAFTLLNNPKIELKIVYDVCYEQMINKINQANVILSTSNWEGSPNIIKEAMACNCPIVATDVGDIKWVIGDTPGCYLCSFSPTDVASKLLHALEYSEKYGRTEGRKRLIKLGLDTETIAKRIIDVYKSVLK